MFRPLYDDARSPERQILHQAERNSDCEKYYDWKCWQNLTKYPGRRVYVDFRFDIDVFAHILM